MRILVAGTTGGIGSAVKRAALGAGHSIAEVNRGSFDGDLGEEPFDAFVFAVGMCSVKPLSQLGDDELNEMFSVNCGLFVRLMRRIVCDKMYSANGMKVVAISSVSAVEGWPGGAAYCASKGALSAVCRALNAELTPKGISVSAVEPRYVNTRMFDACAGRMGVSKSLAKDPGELAKEILELL